MDLIKQLIDLILHVDKYLDAIIRTCGNWTYLILFIVVFCETGLVATPFLPGDSLLFAVGAFAARGSPDLAVSFVLLCAAAILGDTVNYWIGHLVGPRIFSKENVRFLNRKYLQRTHAFYERHGGKTIIIARFMPIIRTFAPFVAGIGEMTYLRFFSYNVIGGVLWVVLFVFAGYYFGSRPVVKQNFSLVIMAIILISIMPGVIEFVRHRSRSSGASPAAAPPDDRPSPTD